MDTAIGVIGGGAAAIALLHNLSKMTLNNKITIYLFEKNMSFGPGNAYSTLDLDSNLLNTKAGYITVFRDKPGDFFRWYLENYSRFEHQFPKKYTENDYVPRSLFGLYLKSSMWSSIKQASQNGIKVIPINAHVIDINEQVEGQAYILETESGEQFAVQHVVLACGTMKRKVSNNEKLGTNLFPDPYPISNLVTKVCKTDSVAIIGSRLSAIDSVIGLIENGHCGKITIYSRSGFFPCVRGTQGRYECKFLNRSTLKELISLKGKITLLDLLDLFKKELTAYKEENDDQDEQIVFPPTPIDDLGDFLSREISLAEGPRGWQAILYNTNHLLGLIWDAIQDEERNIFFSSLLAAAISMRVSIPKENAQKLLHYFNEGKIDFVTGNAHVTENIDGGFNITSPNQIQQADTIIYATGSPRNIAEADAPLLTKLIKKGIAAEHQFGGINVDKNHFVLNQENEANKKFFAIGEIVSGKFLFTSALDIIISQSEKCAHSIKIANAERYNAYGEGGSL
ncbi:hypothetical protein A9G41_03150 [Gilliamella sp. Nev5-1]|uniref:FAD/NAD(P)-binding protein n=1 Tax=unclassified Gilliamella TaxID=2685620 RepID=UPI00080EC03C|nr:FAD/NAD(P)-binding protein [Gilliamella apicola]OCG61146.1 hypothetical protein A9G40_01505 [Gilliamella apicola]OCG71161.1 hypothetical protein A9G41_03150 [Gilliamella apicola]